MSKIVAFMALHYGTDYIKASIRSVIDYVNEFHIAYSPIGSHGFRSDKPCPDSRVQLYALARAQAGDKLRWHDGIWEHEGKQRDSIYQYAPDADAIIVVDSDEIYPENLIKRIDEYLHTVTNSIPPARFIRLPFVHFYRDLHHAIIHDPAFPVRIICPRIDAKYGETSWNSIYARGSVAHMGYAQRSEIIRYKLSIHGHSNELRCSADEYVDIIYLNQSRWIDLHPVGSDYWNAEEVNPLDYLPIWMREHKYFNTEIIP